MRSSERSSETRSSAAWSRQRKSSKSMGKAPPMNTEAHQHLRMAQLLRRKALSAANPETIRRKANSFLVLAKMAAKHAAQQPQARIQQRRPNDKRVAPNQ